MRKPFDIKAYLEAWPYDAEHDVRIVQTSDGREVMQVRLPLGLEQYELSGRPDGDRPHDAESALQFYQEQQAARAAFRLSPEACEELFEEGLLYYYRYLRLFQLEDWPRTARDTARNLELFDFVQRYAEREEDRQYLEQWRPYLLRIHAVAKAMMALEKKGHARAVEILREAIAAIEALPVLDEPAFHFERDRSLTELAELAERVSKTRPLSQAERLAQALRTAVENEEYERAAEIRDRIRRLDRSQN
jgi:hypothetical protein